MRGSEPTTGAMGINSCGNRDMIPAGRSNRAGRCAGDGHAQLARTLCLQTRGARIAAARTGDDQRRGSGRPDPRLRVMSGEAATSHLAKGLGRAFAGALLFSLPMLMTMELWRHGAAMDRWRLLQLFVLAAPLLVGMAHRLGFEATFGWRDDLRDAFIALGIGCLTSAAILVAFNVLSPGMSLDEIVGKVAIQSVPAAMGALLGRSQLGGDENEDEEADEDDQALSGYFGTLFLMLVGALFFSLNMAPTDEMIVISYKMTRVARAGSGARVDRGDARLRLRGRFPRRGDPGAARALVAQLPALHRRRLRPGVR